MLVDAQLRTFQAQDSGAATCKSFLGQQRVEWTGRVDRASGGSSARSMLTVTSAWRATGRCRAVCMLTTRTAVLIVGWGVQQLVGRGRL